MLLCCTAAYRKLAVKHHPVRATWASMLSIVAWRATFRKGLHLKECSCTEGSSQGASCASAPLQDKNPGNQAAAAEKFNRATLRARFLEFSRAMDPREHLANVFRKLSPTPRAFPQPVPGKSAHR